jgi:thymidine kinase
MNYYEGKKGWIEAIVGPMLAGKTEELFRRVRRMDYAHKNYMVFKPVIDNRYSFTDVVSHNKKSVHAVAIRNASDLRASLKLETQAIVIDEGQFFDPSFFNDIVALANEGYRIICGGLDTDFRGERFGIIGSILAVAEDVMKITAICVCCGDEATKTQRIINGKPAYYDDPNILVGEKESYEARCRCCYTVLYHDKI